MPDLARRLRRTLWPIAQTTVAAGLAWYLAHDVLDHREPFFAPIAAAVCLWMTNRVRAELAVEMIIGVALGIGAGTVVLAVFGAGPIGMGAAVMLSLTLAVLIARSFSTQRSMFINQSVISAILIMAFPHTGLGVERLYDALIGGGLAVVFSILLFPKNPLAVLHDASGELLTALHDILAQIGSRSADSASPDQGWALAAADRLQRCSASL
ncbi:FUSC family protein, partial [Mycobacterium avium]